MILTPTATKVVTAGVTEAPPFEPAHQALGNHFVKTLPVLLGNEDPGKHCGIRHNLRLTRKTKGKQRWRGKLCVQFRLSFLLFYIREISHTLKESTERNCIKAAKIHYPDLSNHPSSKVSRILPTKNRGILVLITYCSNYRIHLIGSKIVQSISSPGRAEEGRRDWSNISLCACMCVRE